MPADIDKPFTGVYAFEGIELLEDKRSRRTVSAGCYLARGRKIPAFFEGVLVVSELLFCAALFALQFHGADV
jgi:hypothetical protein